MGTDRTDQGGSWFEWRLHVAGWAARRSASAFNLTGNTRRHRDGPGAVANLTAARLPVVLWQ